MQDWEAGVNHPGAERLKALIQVLLQGHQCGVRDIAIDAAGRMVVSAAFDGSIRVWSMETSRCLAALRRTPAAYWVWRSVLTDV